MTSYFEFNAKKPPERDVIEPDDTLVDTGVFVEHGYLDTETRRLFETAFMRATTDGDWDEDGNIRERRND